MFERCIKPTGEGRPSDMHRTRDRNDVLAVRFSAVHPAARARFITGKN
jgi:hypothetical protein